MVIEPPLVDAPSSLKKEKGALVGLSYGLSEGKMADRRDTQWSNKGYHADKDRGLL